MGNSGSNTGLNHDPGAIENMKFLTRYTAVVNSRDPDALTAFVNECYSKDYRSSTRSPIRPTVFRTYADMISVYKEWFQKQTTFSDVEVTTVTAAGIEGRYTIYGFTGEWIRYRVAFDAVQSAWCNCEWTLLPDDVLKRAHDL